MKVTQSIIKMSVRTPAAAELKAKKDSLVRGESKPSRVFRIEKKPDGAFSRTEVNPETQRRKSTKVWEAKSEVAKVRQSLDLSQEAFAGLLGIGLSTLRSWEQNKRQPSGTADFCTVNCHAVYPSGGRATLIDE
jgi:DNA-binding transcriptional regulator YiaG